MPVSISTILKFRSENDRAAAIALDRAVNGVKDSMVENMQDAKAGVERASWYSSCLFDRYEDVCSQLKGEDKRFFKSVFEIYKRKDIIADMLEMYIELELKNTNHSTLQIIEKKLTKILVDYSGAQLTRKSMAASLAILIVNSFGFQNSLLLKISKSSFTLITVAALYGKMQEAAFAARRLRVLSPELYHLLYANNMEMLYFLVSEKIDKALVNSVGLRGEDRFISIINSLAN
ncbi:hypothetical protein ACINJI_001199 [Cronobacter dublinensis]